MFSDPDGTLVGSIDWRGIIDGRDEPRPFAGLDAASDVLLVSPAIAALLADRGTLLSWVESSERRAMVLGPVERAGEQQAQRQVASRTSTCGRETERPAPGPWLAQYQCQQGAQGHERRSLVK